MIPSMSGVIRRVMRVSTVVALGLAAPPGGLTTAAPSTPPGDSEPLAPGYVG